MTEELKPVPCGCGGEAEARASCFMTVTELYLVQCKRCGTATLLKETEAEAVTAWNRAMSGSDYKSKSVERTAKVIEHDASVTDTDGNKYHRSEYLCGACKKKVLGGDEYCSRCGAKLDWDEDIPMEYFESGGI